MTDLMRYDIIQRLIDHHGYKVYLEIGIHKGNTWNRIVCDNKRGIDPEKHVDSIYIHEETSDEYFAYRDKITIGKSSPEFDIVFIDGLHRAEQVWRDIRNSLRYLNPGGCIVLHDCNPPTLAHAGPEPEIFKPPLPTGEPHYVWCGTVWQAAYRLGELKFSEHDDFYTVDTDWGVSVWEIGNKTQLFPSKIDEETNMDFWNYFDQNRQEILNLITVDEFNRRYPPK